VEKVLVLRLARLIETELGSDYRVSLTRNDDYRVAVLRRTEIANNLQADLFISLHAGGGFSPNAGGMSIYTFKPPEGLPGVLPGRTVPSAEDAEPARLWDRLQQKHAVASRRLAEAVQIRIEQRAAFTNCRAATAPLMVLQGADMPAILIEIGYLTNPVEEKALMDGAVLNDLARAIGEGIADFLKDRAPP
jgi:N-acetylmuramoyl-L-alanine amidase